MIVTRLLLCAALGVSYVQSQLAGSAASTAGIPLSQNIGNGATSTNIPSGLGGASTGSVVIFTPGATLAPPFSSVIKSTPTGAAASEQQASLSSQSEHNLGSKGLNTGTTGAGIVGISTGIPGGYDTPSSTPVASTPAASPSGKSDSATSFTLSSSSGSLLWAMSTVAFLMGALFVL